MALASVDSGLGFNLCALASSFFCGEDGHLAHLLPDAGSPEVRLELAQAGRAEVHEVSGLVNGDRHLAAVTVLVSLGSSSWSGSFPAPL